MHSPLSQLALHLVSCHTPWIVGVVSRGGLSALHTSEVLAARPRAIATICVLSFIFLFLCLIWFCLFRPSLISHRENSFQPFTEVQNGNRREVTGKYGNDRGLRGFHGSGKAIKTERDSESFREQAKTAKILFGSLRVNDSLCSRCCLLLQRLFSASSAFGCAQHSASTGSL